MLMIEKHITFRHQTLMHRCIGAIVVVPLIFFASGMFFYPEYTLTDFITSFLRSTIPQLQTIQDAYLESSSEKLLYALHTGYFLWGGVIFFQLPLTLFFLYLCVWFYKANTEKPFLDISENYYDIDHYMRRSILYAPVFIVVILYGFYLVAYDMNILEFRRGYGDIRLIVSVLGGLFLLAFAVYSFVTGLIIRKTQQSYNKEKDSNSSKKRNLKCI